MLHPLNKETVGKNQLQFSNHLLATPAEKSWMEDVSFPPVSRRSLSFNLVLKIRIQFISYYNLPLMRIIRLYMPDVVAGQFVNCPLKTNLVTNYIIYIFSTTSISIIPFSSLIFLVEKFVCAPAPFHSPYIACARIPFVFSMITTCIGLGSMVTRSPKSSATL